MENSNWLILLKSKSDTTSFLNLKTLVCALGAGMLNKIKWNFDFKKQSTFQEMPLCLRSQYQTDHSSLINWSLPLADFIIIAQRKTLRLLTLFSRLPLKWIKESKHFFFFPKTPTLAVSSGEYRNTRAVSDASKKHQDDKKQNVTSHWVVDPQAPHPSYWWKRQFI